MCSDVMYVVRNVNNNLHTYMSTRKILSHSHIHTIAHPYNHTSTRSDGRKCTHRSTLTSLSNMARASLPILSMSLSAKQCPLCLSRTLITRPVREACSTVCQDKIRMTVHESVLCMRAGTSACACKCVVCVRIRGRRITIITVYACRLARGCVRKCNCVCPDVCHSLCVL